MDVNERLKNLKRNPYYKVSLVESVAKSWQRNNVIKKFLLTDINLILWEVYEPLGMWGQNPQEKKNNDYGVIIDNLWSALNQADTNYSGHCLIFNKCNAYIANLYYYKGIESITIDGTVFSYKDPIVFYENDSQHETIEKIKKIMKIVRHKKNEIFLIGSKTYKILVDLYDKTMGFGDLSQKFYEKDIHYFFPDIVEFESTNGRGNYKDRKEGTDIWKTHNGYKTSDQVKGISYFEKHDDGYFIDVSISENSNCDYYVFVSIDRIILVFKNEKDKIRWGKTGVFFPNEILYKLKKYD